MFGSSSIRAYLENGDLDTTWGATNINFNFDPPRIEFDPVRELDFSATNTSVCDKEGRLMCYSNGMQINSGVDHSILEDTIAYCLYWKDRTYYTEEDKLVALGFTFPDMAIIVPEPGDDKSFYLFMRIGMSHLRQQMILIPNMYFGLKLLRILRLIN